MRNKSKVRRVSRSVLATALDGLLEERKRLAKRIEDLRGLAEVPRLAVAARPGERREVQVRRQARTAFYRVSPSRPLPDPLPPRPEPKDQER